MQNNYGENIDGEFLELYDENHPNYGKDKEIMDKLLPLINERDNLKKELSTE